MLYLIATPIGHLGDLSFRAVAVMQACDYILCEDTRHSLRLLQHYEIKKPLKSFHAFNESNAIDKILIDLKAGADIALISDAGTPLVCDPGFSLSRRCKEEKIPFTVLPGANAALLGLLHSGFPPLPFQCVDFLPKKQSERLLALVRILLYQGTTICHETPHRLLETLSQLVELSPDRLICVARELTKVYEESQTGSPKELLAHYSAHPPRGEILIIISPFTPPAAFEKMSVEELVDYLCKDFSMSLKEAIKLAAELHQLPKRKVYKSMIEN
jgi:16S rRNA (cytidine1402-2'-O)-methyltransferase